MIGKKIKRICKKFKVKFLVNDDVLVAKRLNADGCHLGQNDMDIITAISGSGPAYYFYLTECLSAIAIEMGLNVKDIDKLTKMDIYYDCSWKLENEFKYK